MISLNIYLCISKRKITIPVRGLQQRKQVCGFCLQVKKLSHKVVINSIKIKIPIRHWRQKKVEKATKSGHSLFAKKTERCKKEFAQSFFL